MSIFISYSHADSMQLAERLESDLTARGFVCWRDTSRLSGGDVWTVDIEHAVDRADVLLALLSAGSFRSDICRAEQLRALRGGSCVIPVLVHADADRPLHLETRQYIDFSVAHNYVHSLGVLIDSIHSRKGAALPARFRETMVSLPNLPINFVDRIEERKALRNLILADSGARSVAVTALEGMGGIGKTVLALALCHRDPIIRDAFPDGVAWVSLGRESGSMVGILTKLASTIGLGAEGIEDLDSAKRQLRSYVKDKALLVILDDVWRVGDVENFRAEGAVRYRLLYTTRRPDVAAELGSQSFQLGTLSPELSIALLAERAGRQIDELPVVAREIAGECRGLPLAIAMIGAKLRSRPDSFWTDMLQDLRSARIEAITGDAAIHGHESLKSAFDVSLRDLPALLKKRYFDLAIFPEDAVIPVGPLRSLWGVDARSARDTMAAFADLSLVTLTSDGITLHDLQCDYARNALGHDRLILVHREFLDAYRTACPAGWQSGPNDGYFFQHLLFHFRAAERLDELDALLTDLSWLQAKLNATSVASLLDDYELATDDDAVRTIKEAIRLSAHILAADKNQLAGQLLARISAPQSGQARAIPDAAITWKDTARLRPLTPSLRPLSSSLVRTLQDESGVERVVLTTDGQLAISGAMNGMLRVWDFRKGVELYSIFVGGRVNALTVTPDGRYAICADGSVLSLWDLKVRTRVRTMAGHTGYVFVMRAMADGNRVISGSDDGTVRIWDLVEGEEIRQLRGHRGWVRALTLSRDGRFVISGSADGTIKVWDTESGALTHTIAAHRSQVTALAVTAERLVSGSEDRTVAVWDLTSGRELHRWRASEIRALACTADGLAVSGTNYGGVGLWNIGGRGHIREFVEHNHVVYDVAVTDDGHWAVSASYDNTLKVWDLQANSESRVFEARLGEVIALAPVGKTLVVSAHMYGTVANWDAMHGYRGQQRMIDDDRLWSFHMTPNGKKAVSVSERHFRVWDPANWTRVSSRRGRKEWYIIRLLPDGTQMLSGRARKIKLWNLATMSVLWESVVDPFYHVSAMAISSDGQRALVAAGSLTYWDLTSGTGRRLVDKAHDSRVEAAAIAPDNRYAVTGSMDFTLKLWGLPSGSLLHTFVGHKGPVWTVAITPDSQFVVSGSGDCSIRVWDPDSGKAVAAFTTDSIVRSCAILQDSKTVFAGDSFGRVHCLLLEQT